MTKLLTFLLACGLAVIPTFAAEDHGNLPTPAEAKAQIEAAHGGSIDCDTITDAEFELAGEAWMESIHPSDEHEFMDAMMGGEGSDSLLAAHIAMGQNYLGCGTSGAFGGMMGGLGNGMMSNSWLGDRGNSQWFTNGTSMMDDAWDRDSDHGWMHTGYGMLGMGSGWLIGGFILGGLLHLAFFVALIAVATWVVKKVWHGTRATKK